MSAFFISPFKPPEWIGESDFRIVFEDFLDALKHLWPDVNISSIPPSNYYVLWWELERNGKFEIMGGLQNGYQVISIEGNRAYIAEFTAWFRAFIPQVYRLYLFHESLTFNVELEPQITIDDLIRLI